jgi:hypothetical protein
VFSLGNDFFQLLAKQITHSPIDTVISRLDYVGGIIDMPNDMKSDQGSCLPSLAWFV